MTQAELRKALRARQFPRLLLLHGEETFLLEQALHEVVAAVVAPADRDFNYTVHYGKETRAAVLLDQARTYPVFASHRLILVKDLEDLPAAEMEALLPYLKDPAAETVLVFTGGKVDGRRKFIQELKKSGESIEFRRLYEDRIPDFIKEQAREGGKALTEEAVALFCRRVGNNLLEIQGELAKLFLFLGERNLADAADVAAVIADTRADSVFDLTNALGRRQHAEATRLLSRILDEGVAPLLVLSMIVRHFRQLWQIRVMLDQGEPPRDIPKRIGINPYFFEGLLAQARSYPGERFRGLFERFLAVDLALKSSGAHPSAMLGKLVLEIASREEGK